MRIVWLSHFIPYPPRGGSRQRSFNLIRQTARKHELHLVAMNMLNEPEEKIAAHVNELRKHCAGVEVHNPPYAWRGMRWWGQLAFTPLYRRPYASRALWSPLLARRLQEVLQQHAATLVHFDSIDLGLYLPVVHNSVRRLLHHHNCESAMAERRAEKEPNFLKRAYLNDQARKIAELERRWCPQVDVNVAVSELDAQRLRSQCPGAHFHVVENGTDTDYFIPSDEAPEPWTVIFAGGLSWYPNISAIHFFTRQIWPLLKQRCPGVRLYLAGRSPVGSIRQVAQADPQITLVADPEDIRPWIWRAGVFVCPILDGGGTRLKILDALSMGKGVVSTSIGCEGLEVRHEENILVADAPDEFARQTLRVLEDNALRHRLGINGRALVERLYSWESIADHLDAAYCCATGSGECRMPGIE